jgi:hypothetical protein
MSEPSQAPPSPAAAEEGKKPYQKPAVAWEGPLEVQPALMASCAKMNLSTPGCDAVPGS